MKPARLNYLTLLLSAVLGLSSNAFSQDKELPRELYIASTIPDSLKENANSVVRYSLDDHKINGPGRAVFKSHTITTILNQKADHQAIVQLYYNKKYDTYSGIDIHVYDEKGVLIKRYRKSDMYDRSATEGEDLVTDERFLWLKHTIASYPVTIEVEYEEDLSSLLGLGRWEIQSSDQAVQNAYFRLSISSDAGFRYLNKNTTIKPMKTTTDQTDYYSWQVSSLKAFKIEEGAQPWRVLPRIYFASSNFDFYGTSGSIRTWQDYGKWQQALNADVCSLTPEREREIRKMTDTIKTDKAKAKFLYQYLQQNMRYVSVQLGVGGWKPFAATFVDQKKYGDCKALSNYMSALLKAVNIPSHYAIVNSEANSEPADPSFPFNYFNHVILCVPFKNDTTWLECTSNISEFGKLGPFTENRNALLVTPDGGKLVRTPASTMQENQFEAQAHISLDAEGGAKATVKISSTGQYRFEFIEVAALSEDRQKEILMRGLHIKQPSLFEFKPAADNKSVKELNINLEYDKFCLIKAADKQFYKPSVFDLCTYSVPALEKRKTDYYFDYPFQSSSQTTIDLPAGFEVETLPVNQALGFTYGNYEVKYVYNAAKNQVTSTTKFNLTNHVIPAAKYAELQQYLDAVAKAQNKKLVIRRKA